MCTNNNKNAESVFSYQSLYKTSQVRNERKNLIKEQQAAEEFLCLSSGDGLDFMFEWFGSSEEDEYSPELD